MSEAVECPLELDINITTIQIGYKDVEAGWHLTGIEDVFILASFLRTLSSLYCWTNFNELDINIFGVSDLLFI